MRNTQEKQKIILQMTLDRMVCQPHTGTLHVEWISEEGSTGTEYEVNL